MNSFSKCFDEIINGASQSDLTLRKICILKNCKLYIFLNL